MKKIRNSKRGFTLVEIIIVVAIIVIVSAASFVGIAVTLNNAKANADKVNQQHGVDENGKDLFEAEAWDKIDGLTKDAAKFFDASKYKPANPTNTPTPAPTAADPGPAIPEATATPVPTAAVPTAAPTATPEPTKAPEGGAGGSGAVTYGGSYGKRGDPGNSVLGIQNNPDGSTTVSVCYQQWNDGTVTVWNNGDGTYDFRINSDNTYYINGILGTWNHGGNQRWTLSDSEKEKLEKAYGFKIG